jgi:hypothetical protein
MKIKYDWYKESGKWYEENVIEIPDNLFLFSDKLISAINPNMEFWRNRVKSGWCIVIDNHELSDEDALKGKFMKALWTPQTISQHINKYYTSLGK